MTLIQDDASDSGLNMFGFCIRFSVDQCVYKINQYAFTSMILIIYIKLIAWNNLREKKYVLEYVHVHSIRKLLYKYGDSECIA